MINILLLELLPGCYQIVTAIMEHESKIYIVHHTHRQVNAILIAKDAIMGQLPPNRPPGFTDNIAASRKVLFEKIQDENRAVLFILWGSVGSGRSWFLEQLSVFCQNQQKRWIKINFENLMGIDESQVQQSVLQLWLAVLEQETAAHPGIPEESAAEIVNSAKATPITFLLDNLECLLHVSEEIFYWLERLLIVPLLTQTASQIVATSSIPIQRQWRDYETRRRCHTIHLQPLPQMDMADVLGLADPQLAQFAYQATAGHPKAVEWLWELAEGDATRLANVPTMQWALWEHEIARRSRRYFLQNLPDDLAQMACVMSQLRWFNVALLRKIMPHPSAADDGFYLRQINQLNRAGLTVWDIDRGAYRFADSAVRQLLARSYREQDSAKSIEFNQQAHEYYARETRYVEYLLDSLPEAIYHLFLSKIVGRLPNDQAARLCLTWLNSHPFPEWQNADPQDWLALKSVLDDNRYNQARQSTDDAEIDAEFARHTAMQELQQLLLPGVYTEIIQFVDSQAQLTKERVQ